MARIIGRKVRGRDVMEQRGHDHHGGHGDHHPLSPSESSLKDPVCGMTVTPESRHRHEHAGRTYFFCSEKCRAKFAASPLKYLAPAACRGTRACPGSHRLHLPDASGGPAGPPGNVSEVRHGARARAAERRGRRESRARRLPAALLVDPAAHGHRHRAGDVRPSARLVRHGVAELDRARPVGAGRPLGRLAFLRARRAVDREPQSEHVDADRNRHRRRRSSTASSRRSRPACSRIRSCRWDGWRCTSRPRSSSSR